ncbi:uncharacterized protein LOC141613469 [Silene latifolia]|uniref:uncharacterized protein LOC141613469 n=1 Tax=Silene latifolia TaxID=37657 RepID=UPI003D76E9F7
MVPWVIDWLNVIGDENCGFRCLAFDIYGDENEWLKVRHDLLGELKDNKEFYTNLYAGDKPFNDLCNRVSYKGGPINRSKWFDNELLFVAANYYDAIFVNLSGSQNVTFLPTKQAKVEKSGAKRIFSMVYLRPEEHFVWVRLGSRSPLPRPYPLGHFLYLSQIQDRITLYPPRVTPKSSNKETPIVFDDL